MTENPRASLLDALMPRWEFGERHGTTVDEVKRASPGEMPLVRLLFAARSVPAALTRGRGLPTGKSQPLLGQMLDFGFTLQT